MQDVTITPNDDLVKPLRRARPWIKFIAVMGFIACGFMVLDALFMFLGIAILPSSQAIRALPSHFASMVAALYLIGAFFVYFMPSLLLMNYAISLNRIETNGALEKLAEAMEHQRRFWKYVGVLLIVGICFFVLIVIGSAIAIPIILAARHLH